MRRPYEFDNFPDEIAEPFGPYRAVVGYIVDGDTFDCLVDLGFNQYRYTTIRIANIDAPEKFRLDTREEGEAALQYLAALIPVGSPVLLYTEKDPDSFGRYIAEITALDEEGEFDVGAAMVADGHAVWREY